jgi:hypothetical protein
MASNPDRSFVGLYVVVLGVLAAAIAVFIYLSRHYG